MYNIHLEDSLTHQLGKIFFTALHLHRKLSANERSSLWRFMQPYYLKGPCHEFFTTLEPSWVSASIVRSHTFWIYLHEIETVCENYHSYFNLFFGGKSRGRVPLTSHLPRADWRHAMLRRTCRKAFRKKQTEGQAEINTCPYESFIDDS